MLDNDAELSFQLFGLKGQGGQFVVQGREAGGEVFIDPDESHALPDATGIPCNKICGDCRGRSKTKKAPDEVELMMRQFEADYAPARKRMKKQRRSRHSLVFILLSLFDFRPPGTGRRLWT